MSARWYFNFPKEQYCNVTWEERSVESSNCREKQQQLLLLIYLFSHTVHSNTHWYNATFLFETNIYFSRRCEEAKHSKMHGSLIVYTHGCLNVMIFWGRNYWTINYRNLSVRGLKPFFGQKLQFCNIVKLCISVVGITSLFCVCITKEMNGTTWSMHAWYYPEMQCQNQMANTYYYSMVIIITNAYPIILWVQHLISERSELRNFVEIFEKKCWPRWDLNPGPLSYSK